MKSANTRVRILSVFVDGFTLEAAEAMGQDVGIAIFDGLGSLVEQNFLRQRVQRDTSPRFLMLDTGREIGLEQLAGSGEDAVTRGATAPIILIWPRLPYRTGTVLA